MKNPTVILASIATGAALTLIAAPAATAAPHTAAAASSGTPRAVNGHTYKIRLKAGIAKLPTRAERPAGYARSKFKTWDDADHDCQDTRSEVLRQESERHVTGKCTVKTGLWVSYYDHVRTTEAHNFDIDHLVPLDEVWRSGGRSWSKAKREAYANDLTEKRTLVAVSAHSNRSKGDRDPSEWMPEYGHCKYVKSWVAVKLRWGLAADQLEKDSLRSYATRCGNPMITVHKAKVVKPKHTGGGGSSGGGGGSHACTKTSSGSCIRAGEFCPQASYGDVGYDASGDKLVCSGSHSHPHWE